jgi:hypothetical protein
MISVCPVGFNSAGEPVWKQWNAPAQGRGSDTWFDCEHSEQAEQLFPLFMKAWTSNKNMKRLLHDGISRFLSANNCFGGHNLDIGIIVAQSALERIAYRYIVKEKGMISPKGFKELWASDKLRLLLTTLGIPVEIPPLLSRLVEFAKEKKIGNLPHAITEIRNSCIHAEHNRCDFEDSKPMNDIQQWHLETCRAGLWLLELVILRLCGYSGTYSNRLNPKPRYVGQVEKVPWSS